MEVEINMWAVLVASLVSFAVGFIWYMPSVFGEQWRKLIKMDKKTMDKGPGGQGWVLTTVGAVLQGYILAHVTYLSFSFFNGTTYFEAALTTAGWMWLGFQLAMLLTHDTFEQRPFKLTAINAGNQLLTLLCMGLVIGWIGL